MVSFMAVEGSRVGPSLELDLREWLGVSKFESHALWGLGDWDSARFCFRITHWMLVLYIRRPSKTCTIFVRH
jgi:hypothetical protein